jgi:hypothetical protein
LIQLLLGDDVYETDKFGPGVDEKRIVIENRSNLLSWNVTVFDLVRVLKLTMAVLPPVSLPLGRLYVPMPLRSVLFSPGFRNEEI